MSHSSSARRVITGSFSILVVMASTSAGDIDLGGALLVTEARVQTELHLQASGAQETVSALAEYDPATGYLYPQATAKTSQSLLQQSNAEGRLLAYGEFFEGFNGGYGLPNSGSGNMYLLGSWSWLDVQPEYPGVETVGLEARQETSGAFTVVATSQQAVRFAFASTWENRATESIVGGESVNSAPELHQFAFTVRSALDNSILLSVDAASLREQELNREGAFREIWDEELTLAAGEYFVEYSAMSTLGTAGPVFASDDVSGSTYLDQSAFIAVVPAPPAGAVLISTACLRVRLRPRRNAVSCA